jgi:hypothetical protein
MAPLVLGLAKLPNKTMLYVLMGMQLICYINMFKTVNWFKSWNAVTDTNQANKKLTS